MSPLVFLHADLNEWQMGLLEALEATECPYTVIIFVWIFVSTFSHFGAHFSLVTVLTQLLDQMIDVEAGGVIEQSHFVQNATHVAPGLFIVWEVPFFVFVDLVFGDVQWLGTGWTVAIQIVSRLDAPFFS